jgi:Leucine-rich repeat (LRR) protein
VTEIWFWNGNLTYIPDNVGHLFPNLLKFWVSYDTRNLGLKQLKRRNFKEMFNLHHLDVKFNDVEAVEEDTLFDLPELKYFRINNNMLKALHKQTFSRNLKLKEVKASTNQLKVLHRDLFIKNTVLEKIDFRDNKLTQIGSDFTKLTSLSLLDFHGNICIDKSLDDLNSLEDLQEILNVNCAQVNLEDFARIAK